MTARRIRAPVAAQIKLLYEEHAGDLRVHALKLTRSVDCAQDVVHEAFQAAAAGWTTSGLARMDAVDRRRWLFVVVTRRCIDTWRDTARLATLADYKFEPLWPDAADQALNAVALEQCWKVIEGMPERRHQFAVLYWYLQWTTDEIAERFDVKPSTVRNHLMQARKQIEAEVGPHMSPPAESDNQLGLGRGEGVAP